MVDISVAKISPLDVGFLRGFAVFDLFRTVNGAPFLFDEHFRRLQRSTRHLNLYLPLTKPRAWNIVSELLKRNRWPAATVRIVVSGGPSQDGMWQNPKTPTVLILVQPLHPAPEKNYIRGVKVATQDYIRPFASAKTTNYANLLRLKAWKEGQGVYEVLYIHQGKILEGATSAFFAWRGRTLITAKNNVLSSITGELVLRLARKEWRTVRRSIRMDELSLCTETFLASTTRNIIPVVQVNNRKIGTGRVGPNTKKLMEMFGLYLQTYKASAG